MKEDQLVVVHDRPWDKLPLEIWERVFSKLSKIKLLTVVRRVCKSWEKVVKWPSLWREIGNRDLRFKSKGNDEPFRKVCKIYRMFELLITYSPGSLRKLSLNQLNYFYLSILARNTSDHLEMLQFKKSNIEDYHMRECMSIKFSSLTWLDLSFCFNIRAQTFEVIGKNCPVLKTLIRIMYTCHLKPSNISILSAIAGTMPKLKHLEITILPSHTDGVMEIISKCHDLELLNLKGTKLNIDYRLIKEEFPNLTIMEPFDGSWMDFIDN